MAREAQVAEEAREAQVAEGAREAQVAEEARVAGVDAARGADSALIGWREATPTGYWPGAGDRRVLGQGV